jgi:hypothetical protein
MIKETVVKVKNWFKPAGMRVTSPEVSRIAAKALRDPMSLTGDEIKSLAASCLSQTPHKNKE